MAHSKTLDFIITREWPSRLFQGCHELIHKVSYFQSEHYYRVLNALGQRPLLIVSTVKSRVAGYWLLYESPPNFHLRGKHNRLPFSWFLRGLTSLYGPVIATEERDEYSEQLRSFIKELRRIIVRRHYYFNRFVAPLYDSNYSAEDLEKIINDEGFISEDTFTFLLTMQGTIEELRSHLPKETRNKLNRSTKQAIDIFEGNSEEDLFNYYQMRCENLKRTGVDSASYEYYLTQWRLLHDSSLMRLFLSHTEGKLLAGQLVYPFGDVIHLVGVSVSDYCIHHKLAGNDALQWAIIEWAHREGYRIIDYTGAHPNTSDEKLKAIHTFKARWGGKLSRYQTFRFEAKSWRKRLYGMYRALKGLQ